CYVTAFVRLLPAGPIVITRDGRESGPMLAAALREAITAEGRVCLDGDTAATPTTGVLVRKHGAAGGVQISASHNPPEYNGLKLFSGEGRVIPAQAGETVLARYRNGELPWTTVDGIGHVLPCADTTSRHLSKV